MLRGGTHVPGRRPLTEELFAQHLESPSGTGRVDPVSSQHALPAKHHRGYSHWTNPFSLGIRRGWSTAADPDYRVRTAQLSVSVHDSEGFSVYDAIVDQINWQDPTPWLSLLPTIERLPACRIVAVAQVHEHAQLNGIEASAFFMDVSGPHGRRRSGAPAWEHQVGGDDPEDLPDPEWERLEHKWGQEAEFENPVVH